MFPRKSKSKSAVASKRSDIANHEKNILDGGDDKRLWSYIRSKLVSRATIPCLFSGNNTPILSNKMKAKEFNSHYGSIFVLDDGIPLSSFINMDSIKATRLLLSHSNGM